MGKISWRKMINNHKIWRLDVYRSRINSRRYKMNEVVRKFQCKYWWKCFREYYVVDVEGTVSVDFYCNSKYDSYNGGRRNNGAVVRDKTIKQARVTEKSFSYFMLVLFSVCQFSANSSCLFYARLCMWKRF